MALSVLVAGTVLDQRDREVAKRLHLGGRRVLGHHHGRVPAETGRRPGDPEAVIAGACGYRRRVLAQGRDRSHATADLEDPVGCKVSSFKQQSPLSGLLTSGVGSKRETYGIPGRVEVGVGR